MDKKEGWRLQAAGWDALGGERLAPGEALAFPSPACVNVAIVGETRVLALPMTPAQLQKIIGEASKHYDWDGGSERLKGPLSNLSSVLGVEQLLSLANGESAERRVAVSFVSQEYLKLALEWAKAMDQCGLSSYLIVCGDAVSHEALVGRGIPAIAAHLDLGDLPEGFYSHNGFTAKGLALTALKFSVAGTLAEQGFDVIISDIDAFWRRDPYPFFPPDIDFAFQRVVLFPSAVVQLWGFSVCSGFLFFRSTAASRSFLQECIHWNGRVQSDQLAINLALVSAEMSWDLPEGYSLEYPLRQKAAEAQFAAFARHPIRGVAGAGGLKALALGHEQFWRHRYIQPAGLVICHPNSPRNQEDKLRILGQWMGTAGG